MISKKQLSIQDNRKRYDLKCLVEKLINEMNFSFYNDWSFEYYNSLMSVKQNVFVIHYVFKIDERTDFKCKKYKITQLVIIEYNAYQERFQEKHIELHQERREIRVAEFKQREVAND